AEVGSRSPVHRGKGDPPVEVRVDLREPRVEQNLPVDATLLVAGGHVQLGDDAAVHKPVAVRAHRAQRITPFPPPEGTGLTALYFLPCRVPPGGRTAGEDLIGHITRAAQPGERLEELVAPEPPVRRLVE